MGSRLRSMTRSGSILALAGLVLGSGCGPNRRPGAPFATLRCRCSCRPWWRWTRTAVQILAGSFAGSLQIAGGELVSAGGTDIFVAKADKAGRSASSRPRASAAQVTTPRRAWRSTTTAASCSPDLPGRSRVRRPASQSRSPASGASAPCSSLGWTPRRKRRLGQADCRRQRAHAGQRRRRPRSQHRGRRDQHRHLAEKRRHRWPWRARASCWSAFSKAAIRFRSPVPASWRCRCPVVCAHSPCHDGRSCWCQVVGPNDCVAWICGCGSLLLHVRLGSDLRRRGHVPSASHRCDCGELCTEGSAVLSGCVRLHGHSGGDPYCGESIWDAICVERGRSGSATDADRLAAPSGRVLRSRVAKSVRRKGSSSLRSGASIGPRIAITTAAMSQPDFLPTLRSRPGRHLPELRRRIARGWRRSALPSTVPFRRSSTRSIARRRAYDADGRLKHDPCRGDDLGVVDGARGRPLVGDESPSRGEHSAAVLATPSDFRNNDTACRAG